MAHYQLTKEAHHANSSLCKYCMQYKQSDMIQQQYHTGVVECCLCKTVRDEQWVDMRLPEPMCVRYHSEVMAVMLTLENSAAGY